MIGLLVLAAPWTWHAEAGAQVDSDPHGVINAGVAKDSFALELLTDTLEIWWRPDRASGRAFLGLRAEGYASQLFISPWTRGERDRSRAFIVPHLGLSAGFVEYLGAGFYAGLRGSARGFLFIRRSEETLAEKPDPTFVLTPEAVLGWWSPDASFELSGGGDVRDGFVSGRAELRASYRPGYWIAPRLELFAGAGTNQDDLTKTRIGGLNPYVVPLAGAAWAEWWVEDYAALRAGVEVRWSFGSVALLADTAIFDDETRGERFRDPWAAGFALHSRIWFGTFFADASFGYAPWIERSDPLRRLSGWISIGTTPREL